MISTSTGVKAVVISLLAGLIAVTGCQRREEQQRAGSEEESKVVPRAGAERISEQLIEVDCEFGAMVVDSGTAAAFAHFAADSATIFRARSRPIVGRDAIRNVVAADTTGLLHWEPYFADVSVGGDLGYTLGRYQFTPKDTTGGKKDSYGYYVTIWKKMADGSWKYVMDTGVPGPPPEGETATQ